MRGTPVHVRVTSRAAWPVRTVGTTSRAAWPPHCRDGTSGGPAFRVCRDQPPVNLTHAKLTWLATTLNPLWGRSGAGIQCPPRGGLAAPTPHGADLAGGSPMAASVEWVPRSDRHFATSLGWVPRSGPWGWNSSSPSRNGYRGRRPEIPCGTMTNFRGMGTTVKLNKVTQPAHLGHH